MNNEKIAELVVDFIYNPTKSKTVHAVQLLVEKLYFPSDVKSYTREDARAGILWHLNYMDQMEEELSNLT